VIRAFITASFLLVSAIAGAQPTALCDQIANSAASQAMEAQPPLGYRVAAGERLYFHSAPFSSCATETFVIPGDHLTGYKSFDGWWLVSYTHPKTGDLTEGWVKESRLVYSGTMGLTN